MRFDLDHYLSLPRVEHLALSPDGRRLVAAVTTVGPDGKKFTSALWELDPEGNAAPRRLTRSAEGESDPRFLPDGSLLFRSSRPDPDAKPGDAADQDDDEPQGLWLLPPEGGEARLVAAAPAGLDAVRVASQSGDVVAATGLHPGTASPQEDGERAKARKDAGVTAQLIDYYPIRFWDHYLGPRERHVVALGRIGARGPDDGRAEPRVLTPAPGRSLDESSFDLTPDGSLLVTMSRVPDPNSIHGQLLAVDLATGNRSVLVDEPDVYAQEPACSPDGRTVAWLRETTGDTERGPEVGLRLLDLNTSQDTDPLAGVELWPSGLAWSHDGSALFFVADQEGLAPAFRLQVTGQQAGKLTRLTNDGAYSDLQPSPDGRRLYALRNTMASPPEAVVLDAEAEDQTATPIPSPGLPLEVPGRLEVVEATASDGTRVRSWLVLPPDASADDPAPLAVFIHGGPLGSWNAWSWRWNPHLLAARGYAVLLPDPGLSTGYGQAYSERGRGRWGDEPYTDLIAAIDATVARDDIDETRTAAMGGSFGGYMANWVAGHTDRFRCIVTHASLWSLEQFHGTTDEAAYWRAEFGAPEDLPERYREHSPDAFAKQIRTPMLVIHGELDHRVPIGEALRLWTDLTRHGVDATFLYFPNENHWILKPPNIRVWYETIFAFLDQHVLGKDWTRPPLL
jgi:dipeptidyl aminopeptidase/acylaminoacyl peptidase